MCDTGFLDLSHAEITFKPLACDIRYAVSRERGREWIQFGKMEEMIGEVLGSLSHATNSTAPSTSLGFGRYFYLSAFARGCWAEIGQRSSFCPPSTEIKRGMYDRNHFHLQMWQSLWHAYMPVREQAIAYKCHKMYDPADTLLNFTLRRNLLRSHLALALAWIWIILHSSNAPSSNLLRKILSQRATHE